MNNWGRCVFSHFISSSSHGLLAAPNGSKLFYVCLAYRREDLTSPTLNLSVGCFQLSNWLVRPARVQASPFEALWDLSSLSSGSSSGAGSNSGGTEMWGQYCSSWAKQMIALVSHNHWIILGWIYESGYFSEDDTRGCKDTSPLTLPPAFPRLYL